MAKKADRQSSTAWILLSNARGLVVDAYQSTPYSEQRLVDWLHTGKVRWRCMEMVGRKREEDPGNGDPNFWQKETVPEAGRNIFRLLYINWPESSAVRKWGAWWGYSAIRIEVARDDLLKLLPERRSRAASQQGRPPEYDISGILDAGRDVLKRGVPERAEWFYEKVRDELSLQHIKQPGETRFKELLRPLYKAASPKKSQSR